LNTKTLAGIAAAIAVVASLGIYAVSYSGIEPSVPYTIPPQIFNETVSVSLENTQDVKKFVSYEEITKFLQESQSLNMYPVYERPFHGGVMPSRDAFDASGQWNSGAELQTGAVQPTMPPMMRPDETNGSVSLDYSATNVQVKNVDEPDFIKNDDKYAYIVSGDKLTIIEAYPAESAKIVLKIGLDIPSGHSLQNIFLNKDRLVVFYQDYKEVDYIPEYGFAPSKMHTSLSHAVILDVSNKENPKILKDYSINGYYNSARMIGNNVYLVTANDINYPRPIIPFISESSGMVIRPDVFYFDNPEQYYRFNTVTAINIFEDTINAETFLMSGSGTIYVSEDNMYITYQKNLPYDYYRTLEQDRFFNAILPALPQDTQNRIKSIVADTTLSQQEKWNRVSDILQETYNRLSSSERSKLFEKIQNSITEYDLKTQQQTQKTVIHKIALDGTTLKYVAKAEVPGRLLNQFSMDESGNRFRIATTSEFWSNRSYMFNNVFVLDENLRQVGALEKIAPDESIYSTRFMGDRLYMVTFQRIDPFFVIDLSTDTPKVLGELKIPGYSNYLHPYDQNHIIGIGKETKENQYGGIETLGVKISIFDVTNVSRPVELDVVTIGKQGTDSEVLWDHKALLFDKEKNILSIPIWENEYVIYEPSRPYVEPKTWRGFYVYGVTPVDGLTLKGKITHSNSTGYEYSTASRSFYIGDVLYTVSSNLIKMNDIKDMHEINELRLRDEAKIIHYLK
jgi:inhibitor of cysteine peptidase